ncbi:MAG: hypothetical protein ACON5H_11810 [Akkermansiaceae bacterium]
MKSSPRSTVSWDLEVFYPENRYLNFYLSPVAEDDETDQGYVMLVRDVTSIREKAINAQSDFLICDTAGRLHTRHNFMEELSKIKRTLGKQDESAPHETFLIVDASTGENALNQAKEFGKAVALDGLILTKMDGSGKGGIAAAIQKELNISARFLGTGEEPDCFERFEKDHYVKEVL